MSESHMKKEYRHVFSQSYSLAKANFKVRNEGSYLGIFWYLLNPLCFFLIILYLRGVLFAAEGVAYYPAYLLLGLIMMNFFNQGIGLSTDLIRNNAGFIKSIKIRYEVFVLSTLFQGIFSHAFELLLFAILLVYLHVSLIGILGYLIVFVFFTLFVLGLSFLCATIGLYFNDLKNVWAIVAQLLLFLTPIFYVVQPGTYIYFGNLFNPLFYFITAARDVSIYGIFPPAGIAWTSVGISICSLAIGLFVFEKFRRRFAELV
jgi:ABC-type polysaccharide/polyol phosphate export permease